MALRIQSTFAAGELDPALRDRTTLDKYEAGLATARNVLVGKTGRIVSRSGRKYLFKTKYDNKKCVFFFAPNTGILVEWGDLYVRTVAIDPLYSGHDVGTYYDEYAHDWTEADLPNIQFEVSGYTLWIFCSGKPGPKRLDLLPSAMGGAGFFYDTTWWGPPAVPIAGGSTAVTAAGTPSGYAVEYAVTKVIDGQESGPAFVTGTYSLPIAAGQSQTIKVRLHTGTLAQGVSEMRVYRRPAGGGAYGYIGSTSKVYSATDFYGDLVDLGSAADYAHGFPTTTVNTTGRGGSNPKVLNSNTGLIYQQRLLLVDTSTGSEQLYTSRTGYYGDFTRNYPYDSASSLNMKIGASGSARILRLAESDGLIAFTSKGVYVNTGPLAPTNIAFERKGNWVIDPTVAPLPVPGGVLFVDAEMNAVRILQISAETGITYQAPELSIFSNHLVQGKRITSMAFHKGNNPCVFISLDDGSFASLTYERDEQMRAWTRHDSSVKVEQIISSDTPGRTFFLVNNNGKRYIEQTVPRYISASMLSADSEAWLGQSTAALDSMVTLSSTYNSSVVSSVVGVPITRSGTLATVSLTNHGKVVGESFTISGATEPEYNGTFTVVSVPSVDTFTYTIASSAATPASGTITCTVNDHIVVSPVTAGVWSGPLNISTQFSGIFPFAPGGMVGSVIRFFNPIDNSTLDLTITFKFDNYAVIVSPNGTFPSAYARDPKLYKLLSTVTGLSHLEGESVSVIADGFVVSSPNNDDESYPTTVVTGGSITLPTGIKGAIIHVGRPITYDTETLEPATVEQRPIFLESKVVNKVYVKVYQSRGLYIGPRFPGNNKVAGMIDLEKIDVNYGGDYEVMGNVRQPPKTLRIEASIPGDWSTEGRVCLRQVDPVHFEILSIAQDIQDMRR